MRKEVPLQICLEDFQRLPGGRAVETVFQMIRKAKAAIEAKDGKVFGFRYSNDPSRDMNPMGNMPTIYFDVGTRYAYEDSEFTFWVYPLEFSYEIGEFNLDPESAVGIDWKPILQKPTPDKNQTSINKP